MAWAAGVWNPGQPQNVEDGVICREASNLSARGVGVAGVNDPLIACLNAWEDGLVGTGVEVPENLAACIGPNGRLEVFPGSDEICEELGLVAAETELSPHNQAVLALSDRLRAEINDAPCVAVAEVAKRAETIAAEEGFANWRVTIARGHQRGQCGWAVMDSQAQTIVAARR